jgi:hypothetical protein
LLLVQEGGYAISYAAYCLHSTLEGILQREPGLGDPLAYMQEDIAALDGYTEQWRHHHAAALAGG